MKPVVRYVTSMSLVAKESCIGPTPHELDAALIEHSAHAPDPFHTCHFSPSIPPPAQALEASAGTCIFCSQRQLRPVPAQEKTSQGQLLIATSLSLREFRGPILCTKEKSQRN